MADKEMFSKTIEALFDTIQRFAKKAETAEEIEALAAISKVFNSFYGD